MLFSEVANNGVSDKVFVRATRLNHNTCISICDFFYKFTNYNSQKNTIKNKIIVFTDILVSLLDGGLDQLEK